MKRLHPKTQQILSWGKLIFNNLVIVLVLIISLVTKDAGAIAYEVIGALILENGAFIAFLKHLNNKEENNDKDKKLSDKIPNTIDNKSND